MPRNSNRTNVKLIKILLVYICTLTTNNDVKQTIMIQFLCGGRFGREPDIEKAAGWAKKESE